MTNSDKKPISTPLVNSLNLEDFAMPEIPDGRQRAAAQERAIISASTSFPSREGPAPRKVNLNLYIRAEFAERVKRVSKEQRYSYGELFEMAFDYFMENKGFH